VQFKGQEIATASDEQMRSMRRHLQIIFQDPYASLNPRMTVGHPHRADGGARHRQQAERAERVSELLRWSACCPSMHAVSAPVLGRAAPAHRHRPRAGGQPDLIVCDEPVSALDVSIQAQVVMKILVPVKRVVDYNVKARVKPTAAASTSPTSR
jgi:ABC-type microcin C transport system duplicated ATPase subunit YejF